VTVASDIRIVDAHWLVEGRQFRVTVARLSADASDQDQRSLGVVMHGDGTVGVGVITPQVAATVELTLAEAHELGSALLALRPKNGPPPLPDLDRVLS
jgi:hypothetical protein